MFYVSSLKGSKVGVTDTADGIEEFYTKDQLSCYIARGIPILGFSFKSLSGLFNVTPVCREAAKLLYLQSGMPVRLKLSSELPFKQFLFLRVDSDGVMLFDGTTSKITFRFIQLHSTVVDTQNNDAIRVSELLRMVQAGA